MITISIYQTADVDRLYQLDRRGQDGALEDNQWDGFHFMDKLNGNKVFIEFLGMKKGDTCPFLEKFLEHLVLKCPDSPLTQQARSILAQPHFEEAIRDRKSPGGNPINHEPTVVSDYSKEDEEDTDG